jgi:hypothetical protein
MFGETARGGYVDRQHSTARDDIMVGRLCRGRATTGRTTEAQPVGSYTITFTPDDVSNASAVVRVDLGAAGARITELTVRAGSGDGLVPGELPGFDLGGLMRAIAPAGPTTPAFELSATPALAPAPAIAPYEAQAEPTAPARKTASRKTAARKTAAKRAPAQRTAAQRTAGTPATKTAAARSATKRAAAKKTAKAAAGTGRDARKAAGSAAGGGRSGGASRATKRTGAAAARTGTGRAYRRTPTDIVEVFTQAPSATALARHYGVPRHTVQGWLRRLRSEGVLPPSSRS